MKLYGGAAAVEDRAAQVVVDEGAGDAAEGVEGVDVTAEEALQRLVEGEEGGDGARVAEDHDETGDRAHAVSDADLAEGAPIDLGLLGDQSNDPPVDSAGGLGPQAPHEAADLDDGAGVAALAHHLVDARGAQAGVLGEGVAEERQIRVEGAGPTHAAVDASRLVLDRGADGLTVEAELGRDGPHLPMLAVVQAPDLGALRGRDHRSSSSDRRGAPAWQSATGSTGRRPHTAWARAPEPGRRQGRRVWPKVAVRRKSDPSRGAERDRRAAGRGGRGALRDCADVEPAPPAPTAGDRTSGRVACSRRGRGRRPRRPRRERRNGDSCAGGAGRPRRRSAQGGPRLDSAPNPWHNGGDWLGLSELETVTRVPDSTPDPHPAPESAPYATRTRCSSPAPRLWTPPLPWAQRARPPELAKPRRRGFAQRPQLHCCCWYFNLNELNDGPEDRQVSRFAQFYVTALGGHPKAAISGHLKSGHFG